MNALDHILQFTRTFIIGMLGHIDAWHFIKKHRPYEGFRKYGWVSSVLVVLGVVVSFTFLSKVVTWVTDLLRSGGGANLQASLGSLVEDISIEDFNWVLFGGAKYVILILMEILVFHFTRRTIQIKTGVESESTFDAFIQAEIRMIKVALRCYIKEIIYIAIVGLLLKIAGFSSIKPVVAFFIQCYFVGYAYLDNYNECFGNTIKESDKIIQKLAGASVAVGIVAYSLMMVPLIGAIAGALLGSVAATLLMDRFMKEEETPTEIEAS